MQNSWRTEESSPLPCSVCQGFSLLQKERSLLGSFSETFWPTADAVCLASMDLFAFKVKFWLYLFMCYIYLLISSVGNKADSQHLRAKPVLKLAGGPDSINTRRVLNGPHEAVPTPPGSPTFFKGEQIYVGAEDLGGAESRSLIRPNAEP